MKIIYALMFLSVSAFCFGIPLSFFQNDSEKFSESIHQLNIILKTPKDNQTQINLLKTVLQSLSDLKDANYDTQNPLLLFSLGKTKRQLGKLTGDKKDFDESLKYFEAYKNIVEDDDDAKGELRSVVVMIAYVYLDLKDYQSGKKIIDDYILKNPNDVDGTVQLCKGNLYNDEGYSFYQLGKYGKSVDNFYEACKVKGKGWPIFENNLINACFQAFDKSDNPTEQKNYLEKAVWVYNFGDLSWYKNQLSGLISNYKIKNKITDPKVLVISN